MENYTCINFLQFARFTAGITNKNYQDQSGRTLLHLVSADQNQKLTKFLLKNFVDTHLTDKYGYNSYGYALKNDSFECALTIL